MPAGNCQLGVRNRDVTGLVALSDFLLPLLPKVLGFTYSDVHWLFDEPPLSERCIF